MTQPSNRRLVTEDRFISSVTDLGRTNVVLNSDFSIWQRGTSGTPTSSATAYVADRWESFRASYAAGLTISRQLASGINNIQYCARVQRDSGNTGIGTCAIAQSFETINSIPLAGQTVTFSFYARAGANYSAASSILVARLLTGTGTDQNQRGGFTGNSNVIAQNATLTTSWQRFSYTATLSTSATQVGVNFSYTPVGTAGAADYFEVTGVQVEVGSNATGYQRNQSTYQAELAACQRYYHRITANSIYGILAQGWAYSTTAVAAWQNFKTPMRIMPTSIEYSNVVLLDNYSSVPAITNIALTTALGNEHAGNITVSVASGLTVAKPYGLSGNNNSAGYLAFKAEL